MSPRDLVYVGHMLDMARKAVEKTTGLTRDAYDGDENLSTRTSCGRSSQTICRGCSQ
jgi:hypothetical protein